MATQGIPRRSMIQGIGALGAAAIAGSSAQAEAAAESSRPAAGSRRPARARDWREQIVRRVEETPLVDSHEHLMDEEERLKASNDWAILMGQYLDSDLTVAGMSSEDRRRLKDVKVEPLEKWRLLEPYWPRVQYTGYGQAAAIAIRELYGVNEVNAQTVERIHEAYSDLTKPGFYKKVLVDVARIDSCQCNLGRPFTESTRPDFMLQDLNMRGMHMADGIENFAKGTGIQVKGLDDWHKVLDFWYEKYGRYAVASKTQAAYSRDVDFEDVPAEAVTHLMKHHVEKDPLAPEEAKRLQDHLFWYCTKKSTEQDIPVKIHTGYYAGANRMPLERVGRNPESISGVLRTAMQKTPDTRFVLMHICYPYYEDLISLAKQYTNCYLDMCWAWIINPAASVIFLKHCILTAPLNKVVTFGGDYSAVEPVVGHAALARKGIARALIELVEEGWITADAALGMVEPLMRGNARELFNLEEKKRACREAPWVV